MRKQRKSITKIQSPSKELFLELLAVNSSNCNLISITQRNLVTVCLFDIFHIDNIGSLYLKKAKLGQALRGFRYSSVAEMFAAVQHEISQFPSACLDKQKFIQVYLDAEPGGVITIDDSILNPCLQKRIKRLIDFFQMPLVDVAESVHSVAEPGQFRVRGQKADLALAPGIDQFFSDRKTIFTLRKLNIQKQQVCISVSHKIFSIAVCADLRCNLFFPAVFFNRSLDRISPDCLIFYDAYFHTMFSFGIAMLI